MEANFFRFLVHELGPRLKGRRIEKIFKPCDGVWNFKLGARAYLLFMPGGKREALFYSDSKPDNPDKPQGEVQWWRKHVVNKKIVDQELFWQNRQLALKLSTEEPKWILMDLKNGLSLVEGLPGQSSLSPQWPSLQEILDNEEIYKFYPQISPLLRKTVYSQPRQNSHALLKFLQNDTPQEYYLYSSESRVYSLLPWPLPENISGDYSLEKFDSAIQAAEKYGWNLLNRHIRSLSQVDSENKRRFKKIRRNLAKLEQDEQRLEGMESLQEDAELIRNHMYKFDPREKTSNLEIIDHNGVSRCLELNPGLTIHQNMEQLFQKAQKGRRGMQAVRERKNTLHQELNADQNHVGSDGKGLQFRDNKRKDPVSNTHRRFKGLQVHYFKSSDGFTILRGKNKKSNHKLLSQAAKPFDFWFHAQDGPGAHVILRRDFSAQQVPRSSILEAASLAALSSYQSMDDKARIMLALVKDIRPLKGAELGQVRVDAVQESLRVAPDSELEEKLKIV